MYIDLRKEDGVAVLTIDRPEALNAMNVDMLAELRKTIEQVEGDDDILVLVVTGTGKAFIAGADITEVEVLDIDEDAFREGRLEARHYGFLLTPAVEAQLQPGKEGTRTTPDTVENKRELAAAFVEEMETGVLYLLGPGTTVQAIAEALAAEKTLLGIDALLDGQIIARDLNEQQILALLEAHPRTSIVVTPLGGNGFIFGRGNKPFTPEVIRRVGREHIVVIATEQKAHQIGVLRVDTGDAALDGQLAGYHQVLIGYGIARAMRVQAA